MFTVAPMALERESRKIRGLSSKTRYKLRNTKRMMKKDGSPWALGRGGRLKMEHSLGASELLIWERGEVGRTESFKTAPKLVGTDGEWAKRQVDHVGSGDTRFATLLTCTWTNFIRSTCD